MNDTETIFNPLNDSLSERVRAYYSVYQAYGHSQASLKHTRQHGEVDYLGELDGIEDAVRVINQSVTHANREVSQSDLQQAKSEGLLSEEQLVEIVQLQRSQKMSENRQSQGDSHTDQFQR